MQAFGRERHEQERFEAESSEYLEENIRNARIEAMATRSVVVISALGTAAVVLVGSLQVLAGRMTPGDLLLFTSYVQSMYRPVRNLARLSNKYSKAIVGAERISGILEVEPEKRDEPDAIEASELKGEVVFENVSFDYGDDDGVLKDVSLAVRPEQRVALVGASGAGKSTLASLILRLYQPQEGSIRMDGVNIRDYKLKSLRRQIGIVLQDSVLFGATIRENVAYGRLDATDEEIEAAARVANAHDFIVRLEDGYDTVLGERGDTLSGGQRQRIAIARAVIRDARVLILDEPMTGLDVESEARIQEALDRLKVGRTSFLITPTCTPSPTRTSSSSWREAGWSSRATMPSCWNGAPATVVSTTSRPAAGRPSVIVEPFSADPAFPGLQSSGDPDSMRRLFEEHLRPVGETAYSIRDCRLSRVRYRKGRRCVLQYVLSLSHPATGVERTQWVTGVMYTGGKSRRKWEKLLKSPPEMPGADPVFEPFAFVPELDMLVEVCPYDRRLPGLPILVGGAVSRAQSPDPRPLRTRLAHRGVERRAGQVQGRTRGHRQDLGAGRRGDDRPRRRALLLRKGLPR